MWKNSPVLRPAIAAFIGMYGMNFSLQFVQIPLIVNLAAFALAAIICLVLFLKKKTDYTNTYGFAILLSFALLGALLFNWRFIKVENLSNVGKVFRTGIVASKPIDKGNWWTFRLKTNEGAINLIYLAKTDSSKLDFVYGDSIYLLSHFNYPTSARLRAIEQEKYNLKHQKKEKYKRNKIKKKNIASKNTSNKHSDIKRSSDNLSANKDSTAKKFNLVDETFEGYKKYLFYQGVSSVCFVDKNEWGFFYSVKNGRELHHLNSPFYHDLAGKMQVMYQLAGFSDKAEAVMEAMTTGNKNAVDKDVKESFSKAGISHVLALSGFHLTIIVTLLDYLLLRFYFTRKWRKISALLIIPAIWAFAFIAGMPPSLVRATAMCSVLQLALIIGNEQQLKNACAIALFIMILYNPLYIMDVGFQLSFLSILAIAIAGIPLCEKMKRKIGKWAYFTDIIVISFVCTLFTFPIVAFHFGQVPLYSVFTNLLISVVAMAFMWAAVCWWIFFWWGLVNHLITQVLDFMANCMINIAEFVAALPFSTVQFKPNLLEVGTIYLTGWLMYCFIKYKNKKYFISTISVFALIFFCHFVF